MLAAPGTDKEIIMRRLSRKECLRQGLVETQGESAGKDGDNGPEGPPHDLTAPRESP